MSGRVFFERAVIVIFIYALHIAISHQINVSPYSFVLLVALAGVIATLAVAFHWGCRLGEGGY